MEYTRWDQWEPGPITRQDKTQKVGNKVEIVTTDKIWVTVNSTKAIPSESFASPGGELALGSDAALGKASAPDQRPVGITLPHKDIASLHAKISTGGAPAVEVQAEPDKAITFKGKSVSAFNGSVPMSFAIGPFAIDMRSERQRSATTQLSRTQVHWRRPLREDNAKVPYGKDRALVVPDVDNDKHYGSSDDSIPSDDDLAKLFV